MAESSSPSALEADLYPALDMSEQSPVTDWLLMPYHRPATPDLEAMRELRDAGEIELGFDLVVIPFPGDDAELIYRATNPPGENFAATRIFSFLYAIIRREPPREKLYAWDPDIRLATCVALSRLIHPTSLSFQYAARVIGDLASEKGRVIVPGPVQGFGARAWTVEPERDWLTVADFAQLRELLTAFWKPGFKLPPRLARALWSHEYAARCHELDARCPFVVTGLEALINTDSRKATEQFLQRIGRLSQTCGLGVISKSAANDMYRLRSKLVHGQTIDAGSDKHRRLYASLEAILRGAILRSILEPAFAAVFLDDDRINQFFLGGDSTPLAT